MAVAISPRRRPGRGAPARLLRGTAPAGDASLVAFVADALRAAYPALAVSNADARRVVVAGAVRVNGRAVTRPGARLGQGDRVTIAAEPARLGRTRRGPEMEIPVLFKDAHIVAVNKPPGLATHATADPHRPHLIGRLARQLGVDASGLGVHQRLDAGTSGVVVFGLTPDANRGLARAFGGRGVEKVYLAVADSRARPDLVKGCAWTARGALADAGRGRRGRRVQVSKSGEAAETICTVLGRAGDRVLIEARPTTGRHHQIRAHLAAAGLPIVGDTRYGGPAAERLRLHAWRLRLAHPVTGDPIVLEAEPPGGWIAEP